MVCVRDLRELSAFHLFFVRIPFVIASYYFRHLFLVYLVILFYLFCYLCVDLSTVIFSWHCLSYPAVFFRYASSVFGCLFDLCSYHFSISFLILSFSLFGFLVISRERFLIGLSSVLSLWISKLFSISFVMYLYFLRITFITSVYVSVIYSS